MPTTFPLPVHTAKNQSNTFLNRIRQDTPRLDRAGLGTLQVNVGKLCNQTCAHCHVGAGPHRKEIMTRETAAKVLDWFALSEIPVMDITGGAPRAQPQLSLSRRGRPRPRPARDDPAQPHRGP